MPTQSPRNFEVSVHAPPNRQDRPPIHVPSGTTHIFDPDDPYINSDAVFGVKESLLAEFRQVDDATRAKQLEFRTPYWDVEYDFVLARAG